jgi:hypothetical protein
MITLRIGRLSRDEDLAQWELALFNVKVRAGRFYVGWDVSRSS